MKENVRYRYSLSSLDDLSKLCFSIEGVAFKGVLDFSNTQKLSEIIKTVKLDKEYGDFKKLLKSLKFRQ